MIDRLLIADDKEGVRLVLSYSTVNARHFLTLTNERLTGQRTFDLDDHTAKLLMSALSERIIPLPAYDPTTTPSAPVAFGGDAPAMARITPTLYETDFLIFWRQNVAKYPKLSLAAAAYETERDTFEIVAIERPAELNVETVSLERGLTWNAASDYLRYHANREAYFFIGIRRERR